MGGRTLRLLIILLVLLLSETGLTGNIQPIDKGDVAPYDGYIYDLEANGEAIRNSIDAPFYNAINDKLEQRIKLTDLKVNILEKQIEEHLNHNRALNKEMTKRQSRSVLNQMMWFTLGLLLSRVARQ